MTRTVTRMDHAVTLRVRFGAVENLRIGVVDVEHDEETTNDHLTCTVCSWQLGVSPRDYAVRLARRHDGSHRDA
jgi:hypothetical protein